MELRVGEVEAKDSRLVSEGVKFLIVRVSSSSSSSLSVGVVMVWSFDGDCNGVCGLVGEAVGVVGRAVAVGVEGLIVDAGEEGAGDSGRRKGEVRGEPNESGEGL